MELTQSFQIDTNTDEIRSHNEQVRAVIDGFENDKPTRVPLICHEWYGQHGFFAQEIDLDYREYYKDPDLMMRVQLEAARRRRELPIYDVILGEAPETWPVSVDFSPVVAPGWVGCELIHRRENAIGYKRLNLDREACKEIEIPDAETDGILATVSDFWERMKKAADGLAFLGKPVGPVGHGVSTSGLFSLALDVRGIDLMLDMYEDPKLALTFIEEMAFWCDALNHVWGEKLDQPFDPFPISDHGIDMLSVEAYEMFVLPIVKKHSKLRGLPISTEFHHCGKGAHLFSTIHKAVGLTRIDGLTFPLIDVAAVRAELGEEVWIYAAIDDAIVQEGPTERIRQAVKDLMESGVKGNARFALLVGDMLKGVPMEHREALYEAVKEFGSY